MVCLCATRKVLRLLPTPTARYAPSDTALGDWYVNRLVVDRQPLLLLISEHSLLPILISARETRRLPERLPSIVAERLHRLGVAAPLVEAECAAIEPVTIGPTRSRSVLGSLVDFGKSVPFHLPIAAWDASFLPDVEASLAETPCRVVGPDHRVLFPEQTAPLLLQTRWGGSAQGTDHPSGTSARA